jgi:hypothetical protein
MLPGEDRGGGSDSRDGRPAIASRGERVRELGGEFHVTSNAARITVEVEVPVHAEVGCQSVFSS